MPNLNAFFLSVCAWLAASHASTDPTIIELHKGRIKGNRLDLLRGTIVHEYLGIPMGKPPIGPQRFRKPFPVDPWFGVKDATKRPKACYQVRDEHFPGFAGSEMWNNNTEMSEDCLYINAWIPNPQDSRKKSIMVWIYGGGFYYGSSSLDVYDARYLAATQNVIVVSMNYRLGILGFLNLGTEGAPGNMGLHDQLLGLKWVQENARFIGGDPDSVTLFGESAGSVSVSLHLLSPLSRDLFHRAILESGAAVAEWAIMDLKNSWRRLNDINTKHLRCESSGNVNKLLDCLRDFDATFLSAHDWAPEGIIQFNWLPSVDNDFLIEQPETSLRRQNFKRCPLIVGSNSNEGSFFILYEFSDTFGKAYKLPEINFTIDKENFREIVKQAFRYYPQWDTPMNTFGHEAILHRYTDWRNPDDSIRNRLNLDMAVGDFHFLCPVNKFADYYIQAGLPVYSYLFTHRSTQNPWGNFTGVMHGDEISFVFGDPLSPGSQYTDDEKLLSLRVMELWANFSKTSHPNGDNRNSFWPNASQHQKEYLELSVGGITAPRIGSGPRTEYCAFWDNYLPRLVEGTANMHEMEVEWKRNFNDWSTKYIVDWQNEYNAYVKSQQPCQGGGK